ncbi:MAG: hypothetical protein GX557_12720 [Chloroflexi bacterium]|nr:hypothetical protein [Chloroflexota bacterium]
MSGPVTATLAYDGQGSRVVRQMASGTRRARRGASYLDDYFESGAGYTGWVRYYYLGGQREAGSSPQANC